MKSCCVFLMWQLLLWSPDHHCDSQHHHHHSNKLLNSILSFSNSFVSSFIFTVAIWQRGVNETKLNGMRKILIFKPLVLYNTHTGLTIQHIYVYQEVLWLLSVICIYLLKSHIHQSVLQFYWLSGERLKTSKASSLRDIKLNKGNQMFCSGMNSHPSLIWQDVSALFSLM